MKEGLRGLSATRLPRTPRRLRGTRDSLTRTWKAGYRRKTLFLFFFSKKSLINQMHIFFKAVEQIL